MTRRRYSRSSRAAAAPRLRGAARGTLRHSRAAVLDREQLRDSEAEARRVDTELAPFARVVDVLVAATLVAALLVYAGFALLITHWWVSGAAAPLVARLLAGRHRRARFAVYVFLTVVTARTALSGHWGAAPAALGALLLWPTPAAVRLWPRLTSAARMARP